MKHPGKYYCPGWLLEAGQQKKSIPKAFWAVSWGDMIQRALTPYPGSVYEKTAEEKKGSQQE